MKHHVTITVTLLTITALALIAMLFVPTIGASTGNDSYLPMIINMFTPTPTNTPTPTATPSPTPTITPTPVVGNVLSNGSFEQDWIDMPPAPGNLINQQPNGWLLTWVPIGAPLWDIDATSFGVPEALHKLDTQLPAHEQIGQPDALILEGSAVYKIFHFGSSFGATLKQTVTGLTPGTTFKLTVPVLMVQHNTSEVFAGASGVFVNGDGTWVWDITVGDREWYTHDIDIVVPADGIIDVELRVLSKWTKKDFFIDDIRLIQQ